MLRARKLYETKAEILRVVASEDLYNFVQGTILSSFNNRKNNEIVLYRDNFGCLRERGSLEILLSSRDIVNITGGRTVELFTDIEFIINQAPETRNKYKAYYDRVFKTVTIRMLETRIAR